MNVNKIKGKQATQADCAPCSTSNTTKPSKPTTKVIYGNDDRKDLYEVTGKMREVADSTAVLMYPHEVTPGNNGQASIRTTNYDVCSDERFATQKTAGFCSAALVGDDLVLTAGHCIESDSPGNTKVVFGFGITERNGRTPNKVPEKNVYTVKEVLGDVVDDTTGADWALVRVDRKVEGRKPLQIDTTPITNGTPITVIGHPSALPTKVAGGAKVRDASPEGYFKANLDTYGGNSGSSVFDNNGKIRGILVRGEQDFVWDDGKNCYRSNRCSDTGCSGEDVTKIAMAADAIARAQGGQAPADPRERAGSFSSTKVKQAVYEAIWDDLMAANTKGTLRENSLGDRLTLSTVEQRALPSFLRQVAGDLREPGKVLSNSDVAAEAAKRARRIVQIAAGTKGSVDGRFISAKEIATIKNADLRDLTVRAIDKAYGKAMELGGVKPRFQAAVAGLTK